MLIRCPWPPTECRPNFIRSNHWSKWRKHGTAYNRACWASALAQNAHKKDWPLGDINVEVTFYAPHNRWDDDAKIGAIKTGQDGIAKAMKVDDKQFRVKYHYEKAKDKIGCVMVRIDTPASVAIPVIGLVS